VPLDLALVLHAHQPVGNFDAVIEQAYTVSYLPFVEAAAERPWLRFTLHFSGFLLDWLAAHHPGYLDRLRALQRAGQLEILGGGYYEPILAAIPAADQQLQLLRLSETVQRHFGVAPQGAWLAERVWEPQLASALAAAGIAYTLLDDTHFELAGIAKDDVHGYWQTEDQGRRLAIVPSNFFLRQAIPFRPEPECFAYLAAAAANHPGSLLTLGDDLEKFGSWPHTFQHVYADGWLRRFFDGLEARQDEIRTVRLRDHLGHRPPRGLVYLPTASYPEMMQWASSACWRAFLAHYPESNLIHKTHQDLYRRWVSGDAGSAAAEAAAIEAREHLLAAECNDVYWHGWFGGLYSPHLRNHAFTRLLAADRALTRRQPPPRLRRLDLLADGRELIELRSASLRALLTPADGASLLELDFLPRDANLVNSIRRRPEPYHADLRRHAAANPANLPGQVRAPAQDLDALLVYDPFASASCRLYLEGAGTGVAPGVAPDAVYTVASAVPGRVELVCGGVRKIFALQDETLELTVELDAAAGPVRVEWLFNLLAPDAPDRGFRHAGRRLDLRFAGALAPSPLSLLDGWRGIEISLAAPGAEAWRVEPRFTVSQGEAGFEAIYQGSVVAACWPAGTRRFVTQSNIFLSSCHF
jgi:alpha-amylase/alpha-mannosidase (GH57 family)